MYVVEADARLSLQRVGAHRPTVSFPTTTDPDPAQLLDIHVDQRTRVVFLVADRGLLRRADDLAGQRVQQRQSRHPVPAQNPMDSTWRNPQLRTDPTLPAPPGAAQSHDLIL
jgi:hypothetical protein